MFSRYVYPRGQRQAPRWTAPCGGNTRTSLALDLLQVMEPMVWGLSDSPKVVSTHRTGRKPRKNLYQKAKLRGVSFIGERGIADWVCDIWGVLKQHVEWFMDSVLPKEAEERWSCWWCWMDGWWFLWKWHGQNGNGQDAVCEWRNHWMIESTEINQSSKQASKQSINQSIIQSINQASKQASNQPIIQSINQSFTQSDWMFTDFFFFRGDNQGVYDMAAWHEECLFCFLWVTVTALLSSASTLQGWSVDRTQETHHDSPKI